MPITEKPSEHSALFELSASACENLAWNLVLAMRAVADRPSCALPCFLQYEPDSLEVSDRDHQTPTTLIRLDTDQRWCCLLSLPGIIRDCLSLYLPLLDGAVRHQRFIIAHLGQSLDAQIATRTGDSFYVTGEDNRRHLHCLRALSDAVVIGAGTAMADDPQLTVRAVCGPNPTRVVIDPVARVGSRLRMFTDGDAPTIILHSHEACLDGLDMQFGPAVTDVSGQRVPQVLRHVVADASGRWSSQAVIQALSMMGLRRLFIEGGGTTVSRFYQAGCLDRLHIAVAPILAGQGIPALGFPGPDRMMDVQRPPCALYRMGEDVLWDFDLKSSVKSSNPGHKGGPAAGVQRLY